LSEPPTDLDTSLAILVLRRAGCTQDDVASIARRSKSTVGDVERWFTHTQALPYSEAVKLCDDAAIKRVIDIDLIPNEQVDKKLLEKVLQITGDDILRQYRVDYLKKKAEETTIARYKEGSHQQKMRELAGRLIGEISLPWIMDSFIVELKPQQLLYADSRGNRLYPPIIIAKDEKISVEISIEGKGEIGHLHKGLRSHLETGGFSGVLDKIRDWRKGGGQYLKQCHDLLAVVMGEIQGGKAKIPNEDVELNKKAGFKLSFPVTICGDAVETASGHPLGLLYEPEALTNSLWLLRYGAFGIYLAQTKKELERYQRMHKKLMAKYASEPAAKGIAELRQKLYNIRDQIYRQLQVFGDMERVPGHCELCSH